MAAYLEEQYALPGLGDASDSRIRICHQKNKFVVPISSMFSTRAYQTYQMSLKHQKREKNWQQSSVRAQPNASWYEVNSFTFQPKVSITKTRWTVKFCIFLLQIVLFD